MKTAFLIAKGPSANRLNGTFFEWYRPEAIAVTNDAVKLVPIDRRVDYCFFTHSPMLERCREHWNRIGLFISPHTDPVTHSRIHPNGFPTQHWEWYTTNECHGTAEAFRHCIELGWITHHHTTTAAHHWLAKHGFQCVVIFGVDGGSDYAPGLEGIHVPPDFNVWRKVQITLANVLAEMYGTSTVFIPENMGEPLVVDSTGVRYLQGAF